MQANLGNQLLCSHRPAAVTYCLPMPFQMHKATLVVSSKYKGWAQIWHASTQLTVVREKGRQNPSRTAGGW